MSTESTPLLDKASRRDSFDIPEGFLGDFAARMENALPYRPEVEEEQRPQKPRSLWQAIRPYVYMAAMFAGVWCMLKMFTMMLPAAPSLVPMSENPVLADAFNNDEFVSTYLVPHLDQIDVIDSDIFFDNE